MKAIFWGTSVFNAIRTLFICYLIVVSYKENYTNLIIALNVYTLTAAVPIAFYLFGFKLQKQDSR